MKITLPVLNLKIIMCWAKFNEFGVENLDRLWILDKFIPEYIND